MPIVKTEKMFCDECGAEMHASYTSIIASFPNYAVITLGTAGLQLPKELYFCSKGCFIDWMKKFISYGK